MLFRSARLPSRLSPPTIPSIHSCSNPVRLVWQAYQWISSRNIRQPVEAVPTDKQSALQPKLVITQSEVLSLLSRAGVVPREYTRVRFHQASTGQSHQSFGYSILPLHIRVLILPGSFPGHWQFHQSRPTKSLKTSQVNPNYTLAYARTEPSSLSFQPSPM